MSKQQDTHRSKFTNNLASFLESLVNIVDYCDQNDEVLAKIEEKRLEAQSTDKKVSKRIIRLEHALDQLRDSSKPSSSGSQPSSSNPEDPSPIKMRLKSKMKQQEADEAAAREHLIINTPKYFDKEICKQLIEACRRPKNPTVRLNYEYPPIDPKHTPKDQNPDDSSSSNSSIDVSSPSAFTASHSFSSEHHLPTSEFKEFGLSEQATKKRATFDDETDTRFSKRTKAEDSSSGKSVYLINKRTRVHGDLPYNALLNNEKASSIITKYMKKHHNNEEQFNAAYSIHEREILGHHFSSVNYKVTDLNQMKQYFEDKRLQIADLSLENCSTNEKISEDVYDEAHENLLIGMYRMIAVNMIAFSKSEIESTRKVSKDLWRVQNDSSRIADLSVRINYICDEVLKITKKSDYDCLPDFNLGKK